MSLIAIDCWSLLLMGWALWRQRGQCAECAARVTK